MSDNIEPGYIEVGTAWQRKDGSIQAVVTAVRDEHVRITAIYGEVYEQFRLSQRYFLNEYTPLQKSV